MSRVSVLRPAGALESHLDAAVHAVEELRPMLPVIADWGARLATALTAGARLLVAGNGGSAAHAQHLTSELVGRFQQDRRAYSALCLTAETSSLTAIGNDYAFERIFARQIEAHARPGDIVLLFSTSGRSANLLAASDAGQDAGCEVWAVTGPRPNPLAVRADRTVDVPAPDAASVQEAHQVLVHLLCRALECSAAAGRRDAARRLLP